MRSRYSAYAAQEAEYLSQRRTLLKGNTTLKKISLSGHAIMVGKVGRKSTDNTVEFKAYFLNAFGKNQIHHELSTLSLRTEAGFM
jgi:SEC-C motif-containing protein